MNSLDTLYNQYYQLTENLNGFSPDEFSTDLLQYGITHDYFNLVDKAAGLLVNFYHKYLTDERIQQAVNDALQDERAVNVKFCLLIDVLRCYDGQDHPTSFTTPEGIALMVLLGKVLGIGEVNSYEQLGVANSATLSLIDIIPYLSECSDELGNRYSLFLSSIIERISPDADRLYRMLLYNLCKRIAEVDDEISLSEQEWLNEIALLNDDDPSNDIDISGL